MNKFSALLLCGLLAACGGGVDSSKEPEKANESKPDISQRETVFLSADTIFDESLDNQFAVAEKFKDKNVKTAFMLDGLSELPNGKPRLTAKYTDTKAAGVQSGNFPRMYAIMNSSDGLAALKVGEFVKVICENMDNSGVSSKYVLMFNNCNIAPDA